MNDLLIDARRRKNLNRGELADKLSVSTSMVIKVEKGDRTPSASLAKKWAMILEISEEHIYKYFFRTICV